jgi:hypothetical protein
MILGQLWYGWAPRGAEGINQEQIVAGSGNLGSRASHLTQLVLPWCYYPKAESRGWVESEGIGVAFSRTPTGRDARGRLGAFFVHALVWEPGTMPATLLPGLWDAAFWVTHPPDEPPERLEPIRTEEELGLGEAPVVEWDVMTLTLAGLLENLAGSRLSALDLPPALAYGVASRLAATLPAKFGLISFSTHEESDRADAYDLVAGSPPGPQHTPIGPGTQPAADWMEAARLLLAAFGGGVQASDVMDLIAEHASSLSEFADRMRRWVEIKLALTSPGRTVDSQSVALLTESPQLMTHLRLDEELALTRELAGALARADSLPVEWRARAAAAHPSEVPGHMLAKAIAYEPGFAEIFVRHSGSGGIQLLKSVIAEAAMPLALDCADSAAVHLETDGDRINLVSPAIGRLPAHERLEAFNGYARRGIPFEATWAEAAIEALVEDVLSVRDSTQPLPSIGGPATNIELSTTTDRIDAWRRLALIVRDTDPQQIQSAARQLSALSDPREADAALEIMVDSICKHIVHNSHGWHAALTMIASVTREPDEALARRLARAALRAGPGDPSILARLTIIWIAERIDQKTISRDITRDPVLRTVASRLRPVDIEATNAYIARRSRRSPSRKWLKYIEKAAGKRSRRRR